MKKIEMLIGTIPRFLLIVFFVLPGVSLFSLDVSGILWSSEPKPILGYPGDMKIRFGDNQQFTIGHQEVVAEGTYSQAGNSITLKYTTGYDNKVGTKLSIVETDNLFYTYKLVCSGGMEFFNRSDYKPQQGEKRKIDGIAVYVHNTGGTVNENARMREGPGVQYKNVRYSQSEIIVPKGGELTVFGRSENQTTIDGVNAYWYYCAWVPDDGIYGWIWGGLIDLEKE